MWWWLLACTPDGAETSADTDPQEIEAPEPAPLAELSSGACPDLGDSGKSTFLSSGVERTVSVYLPEDRAPGMPVLFVWHPLGWTATQYASALELADWADENGYVVIVPHALPDAAFEWNFFAEGDGDLQLYDDLRTCVADQLDADLYRVASTGMSAGGLWTTFLSMRRSDTLSSVVVMSGGTEPIMRYLTPDVKFPALLLWGGEDDTYGSGFGSVDFNATMLDYTAKLQADEHFVVEWNHGEGHTIPREGMDATSAWVLAHRYGEPSPFLDGDLSDLPDGCVLP